MRTNLRRLREKQGIKVADMAKKIGSSAAFVRMMESHPKFLAPNHPVVERVARALDVPKTVVTNYAKRAPLSAADIERSNARLGKPGPRAAKNAKRSSRRVRIIGTAFTDTPQERAAHTNGRVQAIDITALDNATRNNPSLRAAVRDELIRSVERVFG